MAGVLIFLLVSFLLFYYLTRVVWVRVIKDEGTRFEVHLPILSLHFYKSSNEDGNPKEKDSLSVFESFRIITFIAAKLKNARIIITKIVLPIRADGFDRSAFLRPMRKQALIYALLAYMKTKARTLILKDNAITLSPDIQALHCQATVKLRLYQLVYVLISVRRAINKEKRAKG